MKMGFKNCLKISYKGLTKIITCDTTLHYEGVISKVVETFCLTDIPRLAVQIYDEHGSKFDKEVFEYFILLFPNPQKLFFIRLDTSKLINMFTNGYSHADAITRNAFAVSKSMNKIKDSNPTNTNNESVPVRRQNCFLGQWPSDTTPLVRPNPHHRHHQQNIVRGIVKKIKMFQETHLKRKTLSTPTIVKRSMRI